MTRSYSHFKFYGSAVLAAIGVTIMYAVPVFTGDSSTWAYSVPAGGAIAAGATIWQWVVGEPGKSE